MDTILNSKFHRNTIIAVGIATFFFGFGAGAALNIYLLAINSPLVLNFRGSLTFISSILGDGIILPIVNMFAVSFLFFHKDPINKLTVALALFLGLLITTRFHIIQATEGLINWAMLTPWHWNFLGVWHALYMFLVSSLLCLFYIILILSFRRNRKPIKEAMLVTLGLALFFTLLRLDYIAVNLKDILPH